ncbi:ankyrin repeat domain-containing protein [Candidatus Micrarchaeota archaeon]|nr:ankyrin repeat domain-containing protein [Candidatus Micrarchaeota archaeon]
MLNPIDAIFGWLFILSFILILVSILDYITGSPIASFIGSFSNFDKGLVSWFPTILLLVIIPLNYAYYYGVDPRNRDFDTATGEQKLLNEKLRDAAQDGNLEKIKDALKKGADINSRGIRGETALMKAAYGYNYKPHFEIVKYLVESGADVKVKDAFEHDVLAYTYSDLPEYGETVDYLKKHGAEDFSDTYYLPQ